MNNQDNDNNNNTLSSIEDNRINQNMNKSRINDFIQEQNKECFKLT